MTDLTNPSVLAREALKRMAARRIAPTPENFARYYHEIAGTELPPAGDADRRVAGSVRHAADANPALPALARLARTLEHDDLAQFGSTLLALAASPEGAVRHDWGVLLRELIRQLERRQTGASLTRKRDALERVLLGFGSDAQLFDKLQALARRWNEVAEPAGRPLEVSYPAMAGAESDWAAGSTRLGVLSQQAQTIKQFRELLAQTLELGVAGRLERFPELSEEARRLARETRLVRGTDAQGRHAAELRQFLLGLGARSEGDAALLDAVLGLVGLLVDNIGELGEDDQWLAGQLAAIRELIAAPPTTERIAEAERRFKEVVYKQSLLKRSLGEAKTALRSLIALFVQRLSEMTESTTGYRGRIEGYAGRLRQAADLADLEAIVSELVTDTRSMQVDMRRYHDEMVEARRHAEDAKGKVRKVAAELERLSGQVSQDPLTGALNRRGLDDAMQREMSRAERHNTPLCVGVLDLDQLKRLNDSYGRQVADEALMHVLNIVKKTLRPTDLVARRGGEAFIILFSDTALPQAALATRRLQGELGRRPFLHNHERLPISFSAGVAQLRSDDTQEAAVARADRAMYQAKLQGGNRVVAWEKGT
jgi:diguanylate cyclase